MQEELKALRELATELLSAKQHKLNAEAVKDLNAKGLLSLLRLRGANKALAHSTEELKEDTSRAKLSLEQADLALQNLLYEKQYYEKEIQSCRGFQSAYSDALVALQPEAEFWASADEDLRTKASEQGSAHELMLQRLTHEMRLRRKMAKDLEELKLTKSALLQQVSEQERVLKQLHGSLRALDDTARPLQTVLSGYSAIRSVSRAAAELLPVALYVLYSQLAAAKEALGLPVNVAVVGSQEDAVALAEQLAAEHLESAADAGCSTSGPGGGHDGGAAGPRRLAKRRRLESGATVDEIYKTHPLSIEIELLKEPPVGSKASVLMTVRFQYLLNLHLVTACCADAADDPLLGALFPLDDGSALPTETVAQLDGGTFQLDPSQAPKPFKWCQHLAGIDLIPMVPLLPSQLQSSDQAQLLDGMAHYRKQQRVVTVVQRLQAVKEAHLVLNALLARLVKSPLPSNTTKYSRLPQTTVAAWEMMKNASSTVARTASELQTSQRQRVRIPTPVMAATASGQATPMREASAVEEGEDASGRAGTAGPLVPSDKDGATDVQNNGLDEGEIPGTPLPTQLPDDALDYTQQHLLSPTAEAAAPNYFSLEEQDQDMNPSTSDASVRPPYRLYCCLLRLQQLEVEVHVRLYLEYPVRPPLLLVQSVRELPKDGKKGRPRLLDAHNEKLVMEQEANITAVYATPVDSQHEMLLHQLLHLRLCVDDFAAQAEVGGASSKDTELAHLLQARQRRRGRDRRPPVAALV